MSDNLPPLPKPDLGAYRFGREVIECGHSDDQMRAYARAAIARQADKSDISDSLLAAYQCGRVDQRRAAQQAAEPVVDIIQSTNDGSFMDEIAIRKWATYPNALARLQADPWVKMGRAKIVPLYANPVEQAAPAELTDAALLDIADNFKSEYTHAGVRFDDFDYMGFARAVLAAAKGKK